MTGCGCFDGCQTEALFPACIVQRKHTGRIFLLFERMLFFSHRWKLSGKLLLFFFVVIRHRMIEISGQSVRSLEDKRNNNIKNHCSENNRIKSNRNADTGNSRERTVKLFQYFMILVLFAAAMLLPAYGAGRRAAKTQGEADSADAVNSNRIVIDPGHGGMDSGMVGESGASEKELNLIYAKKLAGLLEAEGYEVVLTRETEDGLYDADAANKKAQDMERRVARIAEENPVLTVSIHQNSYPEDTSVKGPQVFYFEQSEEGEKLAAAIQDSLNTELAVGRPRTQKGNTTYYILKRSISTTVIVECGFLTNPEEEALLQEESYQDQVVRAVCDGILEYLREYKAAE